MLVLAIDPGYERLGIAILKKNKNKEELVYSDCFETKKEILFKKRFNLLGREIRRIIKKFKPEILAIESVFFNKNQKTAMKVSEIRGAIINIALFYNLEIREFTPLQVKVAVTGYGRAPKNQVIEMVKKLIKIDDRKRKDDEFDAIAVGLTCLASEVLLKKQ